jgi:hypothetical protein
VKKIALLTLLTMTSLSSFAQTSKIPSYQSEISSNFITANSLDDAYEVIAKVAKQKKMGIYVASKNVAGDQYGKYTPQTFEVDKFRKSAMQELANASANRLEVRNKSGQVVGYIIVVSDSGILSPTQVKSLIGQ